MSLIYRNSAWVSVKSAVRSIRITRQVIIVGSSWFARIVSAIVSLAVVRVLLDGLGSDQFAIFVILNSLVAWYTLADFGVGVSVQNFISEQRAMGNAYGTYVIAVGLIGIVLLTIAIVILYLSSPFLAELVLGKFDFLDAREKSNLVFLSGTLFIGTSIGSIAFRIWYAEIKGHFSNLVPALSAVLGFMAAWAVMLSNVKNKLLLGLLMFTLPSTLIALAVFGRQIATATKRRSHFEWKIFTKIVRRGSRFWVLYVMHASVVNVDYIVMAQFLSAQNIVSYSIASRIFGFVAFFYTSLYAALWPRFTESITNGDWVSVKKSLLWSFLFSSGLIVSLTGILMLFMPEVLRLLAPKATLSIPYLFVLLLGGYHILIAWIHGFGIPLQSMSDIKILLIWTPIQAMLSIAFQIILTPLLGIYGITLGMLLSFLLTMAWVVPRRVISLYKTSNVMRASA